MKREKGYIAGRESNIEPTIQILLFSVSSLCVSICSTLACFIFLCARDSDRKGKRETEHNMPASHNVVGVVIVWVLFVLKQLYFNKKISIHLQLFTIVNIGIRDRHIARHTYQKFWGENIFINIYLIISMKDYLINKRTIEQDKKTLD